jgi:hypothetical protein
MPLTPSAARTLKWAAVAVAVVVILALVARLAGAGARRYSPRFVHDVRSLVRNAAQWSTTAAQDSNPLLALLHANTALSYAHVARRLVPAGDAERVADVNLDELVQVLEEQQMEAMRRIHDVCPNLQPDGVYAVATGWLG